MWDGESHGIAACCCAVQALPGELSSPFLLLSTPLLGLVASGGRGLQDPHAGPLGSVPQVAASRGRGWRGRASRWRPSSATTACTAAWPPRAAPSPTPTSAWTAARPRRPSTASTRPWRDGRSSSPSPGPRAAATPIGSWTPSASSWDTASPSWMISSPLRMTTRR